MTFTLNKIEEENYKKSLEALNFLLDDTDDIKSVFSFSPGGGLGVMVKVTLIGKKGDDKIEITKDITDYASW